MNSLLEKLAQGDMRTIGRSEEVVNAVLQDNSLFPDLFEGLRNENPAVRMRSADALEKVIAKIPELLKPYRCELLEIAKTATQQEVQWHIAQMLVYQEFEGTDNGRVYGILNDYYHNSKSNIVKVMSLDTMCRISQTDIVLREKVKMLLDEAVRHGSPSVTRRAKKLLGKYYNEEH